MFNRLASLLKVRADERRLVLLVALLFACIQAGQGIGDNAASALFLLRYGVDFLPYMYIFLGALTFATTLAYSVALGRFAKGRFFLWMIASFIALLFLERAAIVLALSFLYPVLWLSINGVSMLLGTFVWHLAGEVSNARQAKRLFPLFTSAGILGSVIGNAVTGMTARLLGTDNLLVLYALLLGIAYYLTRMIVVEHFRSGRVSTEKSNLWKDLRAGFDYVRLSPLMRLIAYTSVLFSVLFFSVAFPFSKVVTASFSDEAGVAGFFGVFNSITTASTFLVSLFLASRIYTHLGIINGVFLMPVTYIFCFAVFAGWYDLGGASIARFAQLVILSGIAGTAWNALFNVVPSQKRGQVLAFNNGVPAQFGVALSGILLIVVAETLTIQQIFLMGTVLAVVCAGLIWRMRKAYAGALIDALRAGRVEVFSTENAFSGFRGDAAVLNVAVEALQDPKATTRRLAAEMLGRMESDSAIPHLTRLLSDPEPAVRGAAASSLGQLYADSAIGELILLLGDRDEEVREKALAVLSKLSVNPSPDLIEKISGLMSNDPSLAVQSSAMFTLSKLGAADEAISNLLRRLDSEDSQIRCSALETISKIAPFLNGAFDVQPILRALADSSATVRRTAVTALGSLPNPSICATLLTYLSDADEGVRARAATVLRHRSQESRKLVLELIESDDSVIDSALEALTPGNVEALAPLRAFADHELVRARTLRKQFASLPSPCGPTVALLRERLRAQASLSEGRLIKTVGLFGDMHTMELVRRSMSGANIENRAAAIEALDTIGDKKLARSIVSLLEEEPAPADVSDVIAVLLKSPDPWLRTLGIRSTSELGLREFVPLLRQIKSGPDARLREAALGALSGFGEEKHMDTLKTVSVLERILLLREIPIFAELSAEDLELVANIAREEWHPANTAIFHQGEEGNVMFVIVEGRLQVVRTVHNVDQTLAERGPGDFVGEMAVIESAPRVATLRTQSDVRVLAIDGETFKGILRERPDVSFAVLRNISRRLREMTA
jgi:HEAT repeat protein/ATP/ADP translocase